MKSATEGAVCDESISFGHSWAFCDVDSFCLWWLPCVVLDAEFSCFILSFVTLGFIFFASLVTLRGLVVVGCFIAGGARSGAFTFS